MTTCSIIGTILLVFGLLLWLNDSFLNSTRFLGGLIVGFGVGILCLSFVLWQQDTRQMSAENSFEAWLAPRADSFTTIGEAHKAYSEAQARERYAELVTKLTRRPAESANAKCVDGKLYLVDGDALILLKENENPVACVK